MKQLLNASHCDWPNIEIEFPKKVKLLIDTVEGFDKRDYNILMLREPSFLNPVIRNYFDLIKYFDAVFCYHQELVDYPNCHFLPFGTCWVLDWKEVNKNFSVSHLTGAKMLSFGHKIRHDVNLNQNLITVPKNFYISNRVSVTPNPHDNKEIKESKDPLFASQFHVCIENVKQNNFFTEKLIDCLATKTVPIYYGPDNIGEFFNLNGMFIANSLEEIIDACNSLNEHTYNQMKDAIEDNFLRAKKYKDIRPMIKNLIKVLKP